MMRPDSAVAPGRHLRRRYYRPVTVRIVSHFARAGEPWAYVDLLDKRGQPQPTTRLPVRLDELRDSNLWEWVGVREVRRTRMAIHRKLYRLHSYWERKAAGKCVERGCPRRACDTAVRCAHHTESHNRTTRVRLGRRRAARVAGTRSSTPPAES